MRAARALFFERGPGSVSMESVASGAGVSKMTVYANFPDKESLFKEVIRLESAEIGKTLSGIKADGADIRAQLIAFGCGFVTFQLQPDVRAFNRIFAIEGVRHPQLAKAFVEFGPKAIFRLLIAVLKESAERDEVQIIDFGLAAGHIVALWKGIETASIELGLSPSPTPARIRTHVQECVDFFLSAAGYQPPKDKR
ncbi:MAG: TetR/AcrR family transcriptional regulator [Fimbriimonadaceae bacterium]|nr:TetR/AcrR family transcriptional regulator [Alphaproteobacteria bacterium]